MERYKKIFKEETSGFVNDFINWCKMKDFLYPDEGAIDIFLKERMITLPEVRKVIIDPLIQGEWNIYGLPSILVPNDQANITTDQNYKYARKFTKED